MKKKIVLRPTQFPGFSCSSAVFLIDTVKRRTSESRVKNTIRKSKVREGVVDQRQQQHLAYQHALIMRFRAQPSRV